MQRAVGIRGILALDPVGASVDAVDEMVANGLSGWGDFCSQVSTA
jgi:hypothetical protein